jgi:hypothetical protein
VPFALWFADLKAYWVLFAHTRSLVRRRFFSHGLHVFFWDGLHLLLVVNKAKSATILR